MRHIWPMTNLVPIWITEDKGSSVRKRLSTDRFSVYQQHYSITVIISLNQMRHITLMSYFFFFYRNMSLELKQKQPKRAKYNHSFQVGRYRLEQQRWSHVSLYIFNLEKLETLWQLMHFKLLR